MCFTMLFLCECTLLNRHMLGSEAALVEGGRVIIISFITSQKMPGEVSRY
jgi:hypothetical protein